MRSRSACTITTWLLATLLLVCTHAHAEGTLTIEVVDQARHRDEAFLLLAVHNAAANDPATPGAAGDLPPPQACVDGGALQDGNESRGGCFSFALRENGREIESIRSRILFSGIAESYVLLAYRPVDIDAPAATLQLRIDYFGFHNYRQQDDAHRIAWSSTTLDIGHPLRRVYARLDGRLNARYQQLISLLGDRQEDIARLRRMQRSWLQVTDTNCGASPPAEATWEEDHLRCRLRFIERRLAQFVHIAHDFGIAAPSRAP